MLEHIGCDLLEGIYTLEFNLKVDGEEGRVTISRPIPKGNNLSSRSSIVRFLKGTNYTINLSNTRTDESVIVMDPYTNNPLADDFGLPVFATVEISELNQIFDLR